MPQLTPFQPSPDSVRPDALAESSAPSVSRSLMVVAHAGLLVLAVLVVWAAAGRGAGTVVEASVADALSEADAVEKTQDHKTETRPSLVIPHVVATPVPRVPDRVDFIEPETVAVTTLSTRSTLSAAEPFEPMVVLPERGGAYPPVMPADPSDDPFYEVGGLYGTPGATRLVYLIDASGSLIDTFPFILGELQKSLSHLQPGQSFAVLFFSGDHVTEAPPYGMKRATSLAVRHTNQWIDPGSGKIVASGRPHADAAIRRALAYQPDAIILLSDGITGTGDQALATRARLLSLIGTANLNGTVFHTLQVRRPDPLAGPHRHGTLELIALQSGGVHRYISEDDLLPE